MPPLGLNRPRGASRLRRETTSGPKDREEGHIAMVAPMFGVSAGQGYVPGIEPTDHRLPAKEPGAVG